MDKTLFRNIFIIFVIITLLGSMAVCTMANKDKIVGLFVDKNTEFYSQPSPDTDFKNERSFPTLEPVSESASPIPVEEQNTPEPTDIPKPTNTPVPNGTAEPTPVFSLSNEGENEPDNSNALEPQPTNENGTQKEKEEDNGPLIITVTKQSGPAAVYVKERVNDIGKYITIDKRVRQNTYTFTISYKATGVTQLAFLYDNGKFSLPSYFYIYDIITSDDGSVKGKLVGEYSYSSTENKYMELSSRHAFVYTGTIVGLLNQFGVKLVMPTQNPTPTPDTSQQKANPTPEVESVVKGATEIISYTERSPLNTWKMSDEYNKEIISAEPLVIRRLDDANDYRFTFTSLDNPGHTNVCIVHYNTVDGAVIVDDINVYKITVKENGRIDIDKLISIQRDEDGTFGESELIAKQILNQYKLEEILNQNKG